MGLFGTFQCVLVHITHRDTHLNQAIAGALTGGLINIRGGWKYSLRGAIGGGVFIGIFNIMEIFMMRTQIQAEMSQRHLMYRMAILDQLEQAKIINPRYLIRNRQYF